MKCITRVLILVSSAWLVACEPGAVCEESCEQDDDCGVGLVCAGDSFSGPECVPSECAQCFELGDTCFYDNGQTDDNGDTVCAFTACR